MKKAISAILAVTLCVGILAGCGNQKNDVYMNSAQYEEHIKFPDKYDGKDVLLKGKIIKKYPVEKGTFETFDLGIEDNESKKIEVWWNNVEKTEHENKIQKIIDSAAIGDVVTIDGTFFDAYSTSKDFPTVKIWSIENISSK